jgi:nitric oxide reductase subunit B
MSTHSKLWIGLGALLVVSFSALLWVGSEIHRVMPPMPTAVVTENGATILTRAEIEKGRQVWQSIGGQQLGSIWGRGSYVAPDWTADWLRREATAWLEIESLLKKGVPYSALSEDQQMSLATWLQPQLRANTFDERTGKIVVSTDRAAAIAAVQQHYSALFGADPELHNLRKAYAMKEGTVLDPDNRTALTAFIWWSSWSAVTNRPGKHLSYTNNWPHDPLVGNTPLSHLLLWSVFSVLFPIAGIALLGWHYASWDWSGTSGSTTRAGRWLLFYIGVSGRRLARAASGHNGTTARRH